MTLQIGTQQKTFHLDDNVSFHITSEVSGTGVILGKASEGLLDGYIVLLDKPLPGFKAIVVFSNALDLLEDDAGLDEDAWLNDDYDGDF